MTAINALILPGETHVFADAGRFLSGTTIVTGTSRKIWPVGDRHVYLFCGHDQDGERLRQHLETLPPERVINSFVDIVRGFLMRPAPFTAFLFGPGYGHAVEEHTSHRLTPDYGNQIKTIGSNIDLDPSDIRGSARALMADQKATSGVVAGWMDHALVREDGVLIETVCSWEPALVG